MIGLFESCGVATDPRQMRALSQQEIANLVAAQWEAMRPARPTEHHLVMNWQPPQRPLDERFAEFKERLAAAIGRRRMR